LGRKCEGGGLILRFEETAVISLAMPPIKNEQRILSAHAVVALIGSMLLVGTSFGAVAPLVSAILENRGFSEYFTGGVTAILAVGIAISSTHVGRLVDRYGTRRINAFGIIGQALGFAGLGVALATQEVLLFPVRFALGVAATMTFVAAEVALLRGVPEKIRGRVMAAYGSALGVGFMLGVFASDMAYETMGLWCFALVAAIGIGIALIAYRGLRGDVGDPLPQTQTTSNETPLASDTKFDWRPLWIALYGAVIFGALDTAISGTYPVEGQRLGLSRSEALHIVGLMALGLVMGQPLSGWLADKFGVRRVLGSLAVFGVASSIAAGFASRLILVGNKTWAAVMFILIGVAVGGTYPISLKIMGDRTPPEKLPKVNARFSGTYGYASLAGPIISAFGIDVMESLGYLGWAVPGLAGLALVLLLPLVRWDRRLGL
jgi:MFS family permease